MATTKKPRPKPVVSTSEPAAAKTKVDAPEAKSDPPIEPKAVESKDSAPKKKKLAPKKGRVFSIHLIEGSSYSFAGHNFVAGRPLVTQDERLYKAIKSKGRFRVDVREGGAE